MDNNKLSVLRDIGYEIVPTCKLCAYADLTSGSEWGTCKKHIYDHLKHGNTRHVSINAFGRCKKDFVLNEDMNEVFGVFAQFVRGE